ncbi:MAG: hypothetical protein ACFFD2_24715 [Promethearchaeota archaeon]
MGYQDQEIIVEIKTGIVSSC